MPNTPSRLLRFSNTLCIFIRLFLNAFVLSFFFFLSLSPIPFTIILFYLFSSPLSFVDSLFSPLFFVLPVFYVVYIHLFLHLYHYFYSSSLHQFNIFFPAFLFTQFTTTYPHVAYLYVRFVQHTIYCFGMRLV